MEISNEIVPCVILAGGKGRRMGGKEKALIHLLDRPLISYVLEKISGKVGPIALNINTNFEIKREDLIIDQNNQTIEFISNIFAKDIKQDYVINADKIIYFRLDEIIKSFGKTKIDYRNQINIETSDLIYNKNKKNQDKIHKKNKKNQEKNQAKKNKNNLRKKSRQSQ